MTATSIVNGSPTADIYFGFSCGDLLVAGDVKQLGPTVFQAGSTLIVMRHARGTTLPPHSNLIFVIDDDWRSALRDRHLPWSYRLKILTVEARHAHALERSADTIVVTSPGLERIYRRLYPQKDIERIAPFWPEAKRPLAPRTRIQSIGCLSAWSHGRDARILTPALERVLNQSNGPEVVLSGNLPVSRRWRKSDRVTVIPAVSWSDYRDRISKLELDIGLYPLLGGPFAAARSTNKLWEYDQLGSAVVASDAWIAAKDEPGWIQVSESTNNWADLVEDLIERPSLVEETTKANRASLSRQRGAGAQRSFWLDRLGVSPGPTPS